MLAYAIPRTAGKERSPPNAAHRAPAGVEAFDHQADQDGPHRGPNRGGRQDEDERRRSLPSDGDREIQVEERAERRDGQQELEELRDIVETRGQQHEPQREDQQHGPGDEHRGAQDRPQGDAQGLADLGEGAGGPEGPEYADGLAAPVRRLRPSRAGGGTFGGSPARGGPSPTTRRPGPRGAEASRTR